MASRALRTGSGASIPPVKNSTLPKVGSYCSPDSVPHVKNAKSNPGGNKPNRGKVKNALT